MTKEEAIKQIMNHAQYKLNGDDLLALDVIIQALEEQPKTGYWIDNKARKDLCNCSECGALSKAYSNYCPNCGAKME